MYGYDCVSKEIQHQKCEYHGAHSFWRVEEPIIIVLLKLVMTKNLRAHIELRLLHSLYPHIPLSVTSHLLLSLITSWSLLCSFCFWLSFHALANFIFHW